MHPKVPGEQDLPALGEEDIQNLTEEEGPVPAAVSTTLESDVSPIRIATDTTEPMDIDQ